MNELSMEEETKTQTQSILGRLRDLVLCHEFSEGQKLKASALASRLGVSRTPITNALAILESEGLVSYSSNRGYTAKHFSEKDISDAVVVRATLEALGIRQLTEKGLEADLATRLEDILVQEAQIISAKTWNQAAENHWYELNFGFHRLLLKAAGNHYLEKGVTSTLNIPILPKTSSGPSSALPRSIPFYILEAHAEHDRLLKAIQKGDAYRAEAIMMNHVLVEIVPFRKSADLL